MVLGPAGPSCCPTSAQHDPGAPWSASWARSCPHSQPLSPPLPCPQPLLLPWLAGATAPPLMAPQGPLLPGSSPSFSFPHWEPLDLRTSVPGETPASPAFPIPLLASRTFSGLCPQHSNQCSSSAHPVSAPSAHPPFLIHHTCNPTPFDRCSSPAPWHCCPQLPSACSALALALSPWD